MMTNEYELPPLPEWVDWPVTVSEMSTSEVKEAMQDYATAAIEAALQSQDREDAERYRFIRAKVYASNAYGRASWKFHYDNLPLPLDNPTRGSVKQHFEDAIDHARRVEGEK